MNSVYMNEQTELNNERRLSRREERKQKKQQELSISHMEADAMVNDFIDNKLSIEENRVYLNHIANCKECYENLEMIYMITHTLAYLDEEETEGFSVDLQKLLQDEIQKRSARVAAYEFHGKANKYVFGFTVFLIALMLLDFLGIIPITRLI